MQPLLRILDYQPVMLSIVPVDTFDRNVPQRAQITSTFSVGRHKEDIQRFSVALVCRLFKQNDDENIAYTTDIALTGEFWSALQLDQRGIPARVVNNAIMMLYGIARGIVGQATAGGVNGRFVLPSVTFEELVAAAAAKPDSSVLPDETVAGLLESRPETVHEQSSVPGTAQT